jgi:hypothetical protein
MVISHLRHECNCLCSQFLTCFLLKHRLLNIYMYVQNMYLEEQLSFLCQQSTSLTWSFHTFLTCVWWWFIDSFFLWHCSPTGAMVSLFLMFLDHTQWHNTFDRTPLDEWSACCRDLYLTTHNTHNKHHVLIGILTHNCSKQAASDPPLGPRSHWDWRFID